jgi:hypothetical protein
MLNGSSVLVLWIHAEMTQRLHAEIIEVAALWEGAVEGTSRPLIIFNGELDRLRSNYYPPFVYPKLAKVGRDFVPKVEAAFYIHNFKGSKPATLFRKYPGPWQVFLRKGIVGAKGAQLAWESDSRPTLKSIALEVLPRLR